MKQIIYIDTEGFLDGIREKLKTLPKLDIVISGKEMSNEVMVVLDSLNTRK